MTLLLIIVTATVILGTALLGYRNRHNAKPLPREQRLALVVVAILALSVGVTAAFMRL
jgi:hypothetical protein